MQLITDIGAIRSNIDRIKAARNVGRYFIFMVKGDAYNHGMERVSIATEDIVDAFGVAYTEEGELLRNYGITKPIYVTMPTEGYDYNRVGMIPMVGCERVLCGLERGTVIDLKINSGMNRYGFSPDRINTVIRMIKSLGLVPDGISTHIAGKGSLDYQKIRYLEAVDAMEKAFGSLKKHYCATPSLNDKEMFGGLRVGLACYGYGMRGLRPSLTVRSYVDIVRKVGIGDKIGYGGFFLSLKKRRVGIVRGGYYDGIRRSFSGGYVMVGKQRAKIIGRVNMDSFFVDLSRVDGGVGAVTDILCPELDAEYRAKTTGTKPYEILTGFRADRAERLFIE